MDCRIRSVKRGFEGGGGCEGRGCGKGGGFGGGISGTVDWTEGRGEIGMEPLCEERTAER